MPDRHHRSGAQGAPTRQHPGSRYPDMTWARRGEIVGTLLIFLVAVLIGVALSKSEVVCTVDRSPLHWGG